MLFAARSIARSPLTPTAGPTWPPVPVPVPPFLVLHLTITFKCWSVFILKKLRLFKLDVEHVLQVQLGVFSPALYLLSGRRRPSRVFCFCVFPAPCRSTAGTAVDSGAHAWPNDDVYVARAFKPKLIVACVTKPRSILAPNVSVCRFFEIVNCPESPFDLVLVAPFEWFFVRHATFRNDDIVDNQNKNEKEWFRLIGVQLAMKKETNDSNDPRSWMKMNCFRLSSIDRSIDRHRKSFITTNV